MARETVQRDGKTVRAQQPQIYRFWSERDCLLTTIARQSAKYVAEAAAWPAILLTGLSAMIRFTFLFLLPPSPEEHLARPKPTPTSTSLGIVGTANARVVGDDVATRGVPVVAKNTTVHADIQPECLFLTILT